MSNSKPCSTSKGVARNKGFHYLKWLRYYLDFCIKYGFDQLHPETLPHFLDKLRQKKQTEAQQKQASETISWFYELLSANDRIAEGLPPGPQQVPTELKEEKKAYQAGAPLGKTSSTSDGREALKATESARSAAARWVAALDPAWPEGHGCSSGWHEGVQYIRGRRKMLKHLYRSQKTTIRS